MANGGDNKDLWEKVNRIDAHGCAHKDIQARDIADVKNDLRQAKDDIWSAIDRERTAREGMIRQIVVGVLIIVVGGVVMNMVALSYLLPAVIK